MGWGYYVVARKNHGTAREERRELLYLHKADRIYEAADLPLADREGERVPEKVLTKEDVESLRNAVCTIPDYWADYEGTLIGKVPRTGGFKSAPDICEIAYNYDAIVADGWELVFFMA